MTDLDILDAEVVEDGETVANLPVRHEGALLQPAASVDDIAKAFDAYQQLRSRLLAPSDFQDIWGGGSFVKRSGWRKLATAFGVSIELVKEDITRDERDVVVRAAYTVRATAPNGRAMDGWGGCDVYERCCEPGCPKKGKHTHCPGNEGVHAHTDAWTHFSKVEHDVPATAHTRANNRALADLFGMGEVSAEEMSTGRDEDPGLAPLVDEVKRLARALPPDGQEHMRHYLKAAGRLELMDAATLAAALVEIGTQRKEAATRTEEEPPNGRSEVVTSGGGAADNGPSPSADPATRPQITRIMARFGNTDRAVRLTRISEIVGRTVTSSNELTKAEAKAVIDAMGDE